MVLNGFDPFRFKQGVKFQAFKDLKLVEVVVVFGVELYGDEVSDYLVCSVFDACF